MLVKRVEQHIIKPTDKRYKDLCDILSKPKDLYNTAVFVIRQHYFNINNPLEMFYNKNNDLVISIGKGVILEITYIY